MSSLVWTLAGAFVRLFRSRQSLLIENLALRKQLVVFKRHNPRPRLAAGDKLFWVSLQRFWSRWKSALIVVSPDTVVGGHRAGFKLYWRLISRVRKPVISQNFKRAVFWEEVSGYARKDQESRQ